MFKFLLPLRLQRTLHLFGEITMSQEKQLFGTGKAGSIGAVRSTSRSCTIQAAPRRGLGVADRVAAQPPDGKHVRLARMQGLNRRGRTLVRPEVKTQQTGQYHALLSGPIRDAVTHGISFLNSQDCLG